MPFGRTCHKAFVRNSQIDDDGDDDGNDDDDINDDDDALYIIGAVSL